MTTPNSYTCEKCGFKAAQSIPHICAPNSFDDELEAIIITSLRDAYAYAYDKGRQHDQVPDHLRAEVIKRNAKQRLKHLYLTHRNAELEKLLEQQIPVPEKVGRKIIDGAERVYLESSQGAVPVSAIENLMKENYGDE